MDYWLWALLLKPFAAFVLLAGICLPVRYLVHKKMPEGKWKTILLKHRWGRKDSLCR